MSDNYNREIELSKTFDSVISKVLDDKGDNLGEEYYKYLNPNTLIELKKALSHINNLITFKTSVAFVDYLKRKEIVSESLAKKIISKINNTKANANGYDIVCNEDFKFIAEVKCNIPCCNNGKKYGANQIKSIKLDLEGLKKGKSKHKIENIGEYCRFMVVLKYDGTIEAIQELLDNDIVIWDGNSLFDCDKIYFVILNLHEYETGKRFN